MKRAWLVVPALALAARGAAGAKGGEGEGQAVAPVVIELFTSQGCSSCPPADRLLSRLGLDESLRDRVVPLAFHVDYWDRLGWSDPWSSAEWSARQAAYCRAMKVEDGPYTPQAVVGGATQLNGTDEKRMRSAIAAAAAAPRRARVTLAVSEAKPGRLAVRVAAEVDARIEARRLELLVALYENGHVTPVARGENGGRTLRDDFVVRRLERAFAIEPEAGARRERELEWKLDRGSERAMLGVAAFLQDPASLRIHAAVAQAVAAAEGR